MTPSSRVVLIAVALLLTVASPASAVLHTAKHRRPNLVVAAVDLTVTGRAVSGTVVVRNIGRAAAPRSVTSIAGKLVATPALKPRGHVTLPVATTVPAGATRLLICADVRHRVRESREHDNCRTYVVPSPTASPLPTPAPANPGVHASTGPPAY